MKTDRVIFESRPRTLKSSINLVLIISLIIGTILYFVTDNLLISILVATGLFLFLLLFNSIEKNSFDGWAISEERIKLLKTTLFDKVEFDLKLSDINRLIYSERLPRKPRYLLIETQKEKFKIYCRQDIFKLSDTLKYLKIKGVKVELERKDHEIQLYLDDKIDMIPITNTKSTQT